MPVLFLFLFPLPTTRGEPKRVSASAPRMSVVMQARTTRVTGHFYIVRVKSNETKKTRVLRTSTTGLSWLYDQRVPVHLIYFFFYMSFYHSEISPGFFFTLVPWHGEKDDVMWPELLKSHPSCPLSTRRRRGGV